MAALTVGLMLSGGAAFTTRSPAKPAAKSAPKAAAVPALGSTGSCYPTNEWTVGGTGAFTGISTGQGIGAAEYDTGTGNDTNLPGDWRLTWQVREVVTGNAGPINTQNPGTMAGTLNITVTHLSGAHEMYRFLSNCIHEAGIDQGGIEAEFAGRTTWPATSPVPITSSPLAVGSIVVTPNDGGTIKAQVSIDLGTPIEGETGHELNVTVDSTSTASLLVPDSFTEAGRVSLPAGDSVGSCGGTNWTVLPSGTCFDGG